MNGGPWTTMVLVLALLPFAAAGGVAQVNETWTFERVVGCHVPTLVGTVDCWGWPLEDPDENRVYFDVVSGIAAVEVVATWGSEFSFGLDGLRIDLQYEDDCVPPSCVSSAERIWRTVGTVRLAQGETGRFDDTTLTSTDWSFAAIDEPTELRFLILVGVSSIPPGVYWQTTVDGTVTEQYE